MNFSTYSRTVDYIDVLARKAVAKSKALQKTILFKWCFLQQKIVLQR